MTPLIKAAALDARKAMSLAGVWVGIEAGSPPICIGLQVKESKLIKDMLSIYEHKEKHTPVTLLDVVWNAIISLHPLVSFRPLDRFEPGPMQLLSILGKCMPPVCPPVSVFFLIFPQVGGVGA